MIKQIKTWWKYSSLRFYWLNTKFNYDFWLKSNKEYKWISFSKGNPFRNDYRRVEKQRFVGYRYKGSLFWDNPGLLIPDRDVWEKWKKKGLI